MLAPDDMEGDNKGFYDPGEHIGNLRREWVALLAPILDMLIETDTLYSVSFDCCLNDGDTSHTWNGYALRTFLVSSNTTEFNLNLLSFFRVILYGDEFGRIQAN